MFRRLFTFILCFALILTAVPVLSAEGADAPVVFLDGKKLEFEVDPKIIDGSTLVPLRKIFESLGATVNWEQETKTVTANKKKTEIIYSVGNDYYTKDGKASTIPVAGQVIDGSTLVPLRFVGEALGATVGWEGASRTITISSAEKKQITVNRVVDGDTFEVTWDGKTEKIRLIGIDTPETVHPSKPVQEGGKEASNFSKEQLTGKTVFVELDVEERDRYGRLLGYVYMEDGSFYNAALAGEGYAKLATYPPNVRWVEMFKYLQTDAREAKRGLWADVQPEPTSTSFPAQSATPTAAQTPTPTQAASPTPMPSDNVTYKNCTEVKEAGKAPLYKGDPGYSTKLDRDGDGIACEK